MLSGIRELVTRLFRRNDAEHSDERITPEEIDRMLSGYGPPPPKPAGSKRRGDETEEVEDR